MNLIELQRQLQNHPASLPRFVLPSGDYIPAHAHLTEVGHVVRNFIDCGGMMGKEEKVLLQTHVGDDVDHRLRADRFATILQLGARVIPNQQLDVEVEYDCCVVAQYPIAAAKPEGRYLDIILQRSRTQCRAKERRKESANRISNGLERCC